MCTAVAFSKDGLYFGRNMDLEYTFGESVAITPRGYRLPMKRQEKLVTRFAMIGMAQVQDRCPLYAEAVNECGLCMAGLNFPSNARYLPPQQAHKRPVTPYELIWLILGNCENTAQARQLLAEVDVVDVPFREDLPNAPLHWMISDTRESLTVECTLDGMAVYDNPYGVLTNNPPFPFYQQYVRQFLHLSVKCPENRFSDALSLSAFSQGAGAFGLPGDWSAPSRFVKALFCRENSLCDCETGSCVEQVFHILDAVSMVRGCVLTPAGEPDMTTYSCCMDAAAGVYYYRTYENRGLVAVRMDEQRKTSGVLSVFALRKERPIFWE